MLDALAIQRDPLDHLLIPTQTEAKRAQTHLAGGPEAVGLAARDPERGMRLLDGLGNDRTRWDLVEAPIMGEGVFGPHAGNHADGFFPLGSGLFGVNLEAVHLDERGGPPGTQIHAAITDDIQHRGALGHPDRVIILTRQQGDGMADANAFGALGDGAIEDYRGRTVGKLTQEMMFYGPEVLEADLIG